MSLEFQHCDYCHDGWFGTRIKRQDLPGGFESEAYKKTNFLQAAQTDWLDQARPICENCLLEAKKLAAEGMPKEPLRFTAANYADPGETLPETDALTFFEEEILSPIQHIVRIFTLHATGQCELRGHVGNLFQNGPQYVRNIPAAIGDMKILLIRRCPKDPNRKQRIPFLASRRRLERALHRVCRPLSEGGSLALQAGALTPWCYVDLVKPENLVQFSDTEVGEEPDRRFGSAGCGTNAVGKSGTKIVRNVDVVYSGTTDGSRGSFVAWATRGHRRYVVADCHTNRRHVVADCRQNAWDRTARGQCWYVVADCHTNRRHVVADCRHAV